MFCQFRGVKTLQYNETKFQNQHSNSCGLFVIYYIWQRMHNLDLSFDDLLEQSFEIDKSLNELKVKRFCEWLLQESD